MAVHANKMEIYLDNAATTKIDKEIIEEINNFSREFYANPSSQYSQGIEVRKKIEQARKKIADFIGAETEEIIFTSGGTEANNFAINGLAKANQDKKHIITTQVEHPSVLETCKQLEKQGYDVDYVFVDKEGLVNPKDIEKKIRKDTLLVSVMHVNNEIGTIQEIEEIGEICKKKNVYFHSDAVQSFKKLELNVKKMNIDLMSVSGHKINAPKGIGFLYVKLGTKIKPLIEGGGQEFKLRAGTENTSGIIALAKALDLDNCEQKIKEIRDYMIEKIKKIQGAKINGSLEKRIYNNINVSFYGIEGEGLMLLLNEEKIMVSTGSACASHKLEESHVLTAINAEQMFVNGTIRITLGKDITFEQAKFFIEKLNEKVQRLREISPFKLKKIQE